MPRGSSGRVVVEIDETLKRELYSVLAREGKTLKRWFIDSAERYIEKHQQMGLFADTPSDARIGMKEQPHRDD